MLEPGTTPGPVRFGDDFELDFDTRELRRSGRLLKLERIPKEILLLLVAHRGEVATREQIVEKIWGKDVYLDTDNSINSAIRKIRQALKDDAERVVKRIEGVERVRNEIEVLPLSPNDDTIRIAEFRAIYGDPALNRYAHQAVPPIHIIVRNSSVLLTGVVNSEVERRQAENIVRGISGIIGVQNTLRVER